MRGAGFSLNRGPVERTETMSTILLVDDELEVLNLYSEVLELMGHRILRAPDGEQALEMVRRWRPDLVVTDWMMPRMNGIELCHALVRAEELLGIPIIMHSGSGDPHAPGVRAFIPKGSELERFEAVVTRTLEGAPRRAPRVGPRGPGPEPNSASLSSPHEPQEESPPL
jgi:CheY-like chemotaxis protein